MPIRYIKAAPTTYVIQFQDGKVKREGPGLSFLYWAPTTTLVAVPLASADVPFVFNEVTKDFQAATLQGQPLAPPDYSVLDDPDFSRKAFESSPMASVDTWKSPVLLIHGDDDRNVSFIESINLITALRKRNVEVEQLVFPDEVHDFLRHQNWVRGYKATAEFFNRRLKNKTATETQRH